MARETELGFKIKRVLSDNDQWKKIVKETEAFYDKLESNPAELSIGDTKSIIGQLQQVRKEYERINGDSNSNHGELEFAKTLFDILEKAESKFGNISVMFKNVNDGTKKYVTGLSNIMQSLDDSSFGVSFLDIGSKFGDLQAQATELFNIFKSMGTISRWGGFNIGSIDMNEDEIRSFIGSLHDMRNVLYEMTSIDQHMSESDFVGEITPDMLDNVIEKLYNDLRELQRLRLNTTLELRQYKSIVSEIEDAYTWDDSEHEYAKQNIHDDEVYQNAINSINQYITNRKAAIDVIKEHEYDLFSVDGISQYVDKANAEIERLQGLMKELQYLRGDKVDDTPVDINFSEVVTALNEIKEAIREIKDAFEPLTQAFSNEESAIHAMVTSNVSQLEELINKFKEVHEMVDSLNRKDFNVTNLITQKGNVSESVQAVKNQAKTLLDVVKQLVDAQNEVYKTSNATYQTAMRQSGGVLGTSLFDLQGFDAVDLTKKITKSGSEAKLLEHIATLEYYKDTVLRIIKELNKVSPGIVDTDTILSKLNNVQKVSNDPAQIQQDNIQQNDINSFADKIVAEKNQIESELKLIRQKIEEVFDFSTINPDLSNVQSITARIYQQFEELQNKIKQLDFKIEAPNMDSVVNAIQVIKQEGESAKEAVPKKDAFTAANQKLAESMKETGEVGKVAAAGVETETNAIESAAGTIVKTSDTWDKIKYVTDSDGNPVSKTLTGTTVKQKAIETESQYFTYEEGEEILQAVTIVKDFKKRASELKKEADKISLAQKTVDKFVSQFESKTSGQAGTIAGFKDLKNFKIDNLDDIEKATQKMIDLDSEYNKITKSFRQGTKSMNPFVNAITGIDEMENKIQEVELAFVQLTNKPDELSSEIDTLRPLLDRMKSFIGEDTDGNKTITDIYGLSKAYGELNVALRQVKSNIDIQKKISSFQSKDVGFSLDLEKQLSVLTKQQAQWEKNGQLTDGLRQSIDDMFVSLSKVTNASELSVWKKQWSILKDEVSETKYKIDAAKKAQDAINKKEVGDREYWDKERKRAINGLITPEKRPELEQLKAYMLQQASVTKEGVEEQYSAIMTIVTNKNKALQKLMSASGVNEKQYWQDEYSAWFGAWNNLDKDVVNNFFENVSNQAILGADKIDKFNNELERSKLLAAKLKDQEDIQIKKSADEKAKNDLAKEKALLSEEKALMKEIVSENKFTIDKDKQLVLLSKQQAQWKKSGQLTEEVNRQINDMLDSLSKVTDSNELAIWKKQWSIVKDEVLTTKYEIEAATKAQKATANERKVSGAYWDKEFKYSLNNMIAPEKRPELEQLKVYMLQQAEATESAVNEQYDAIFTIIKNKNNALRKLMSAKGPNDKQYWQDQYSAWYGAWNGLDQDVVSNFFADAGNQAILGVDKVDKFNDELERSTILANKLKDQKYNTEQKEQEKANKANQDYGKTDFNSLSKFSESVHASIRALQNDGTVSTTLNGLVSDFDEAYAKIEAMRKQFNEDPTSVTSELKNQFQDSVHYADGLRQKIIEIFNESKKLDGLGELIGVSKAQVGQLEDLKAAMIGFANQLEGGTVEIKGFNQSGDQMYITLRQSEDAIKNITIALDGASGHLKAFNTGTKQVTNEWQDFKTQVVDGTKKLVGMYVGFQEGIQAVRAGLNYVKEIDLAMTELKKVTDETDASYKQFLEDAGSTSAVIGSTISDFTEASATFARLGYSLEESSSMAETAIIYKNVADGLDAVEESSESIISTMMAFGIEASDTMSIIDRFNAVGNNFAITSAGIGDALKKSASALYSAGNTIDESVALVTAANSVIQNPEQVGKCLPTIK